MLKIIFGLLCSIPLIQKVNGQCLSETDFFTKDIGSFDDHMNFPMNFHINGDSVNGYAGYEYRINTKPFFKIRLIGKPQCNWNSNFTEGETSYEALVLNEPKPATPATFKILYKKSGEKYLLLYYPGNKETRVFTIITAGK